MKSLEEAKWVISVEDFCPVNKLVLHLKTYVRFEFWKWDSNWTVRYFENLWKIQIKIVA